MDPQEGKSLVRALSNRSRKAARIGTRFLVPRVFDDHGAPLTNEQISSGRYIWDFSLRETRFLKALQDADGDFDKACQDRSESPDWAKKFLKSGKCEGYLKELDHKAALAEIADPRWIKAKYVGAAIGEEQMDDTQKWAMDRLKDIIIPKQLASLKIEQNVYQMPQMTPEQAKAAKEFFDTIATQPEIPSA